MQSAGVPQNAMPLLPLPAYWRRLRHANSASPSVDAIVDIKFGLNAQIRGFKRCGQLELQLAW